MRPPRSVYDRLPEHHRRFWEGEIGIEEYREEEKRYRSEMDYLRLSGWWIPKRLLFDGAIAIQGDQLAVVLVEKEIPDKDSPGKTKKVQVPHPKWLEWLDRDARGWYDTAGNRTRREEGDGDDILSMGELAFEEEQARQPAGWPQFPFEGI